MRGAVAKEEPGVREQEQPVDTVRRAVARLEPEVRARESRLRALASGKIIHQMACTFVNGEYLFISPVAYGMNPVFTAALHSSFNINTRD